MRERFNDFLYGIKKSCRVLSLLRFCCVPREEKHKENLPLCITATVEEWVRDTNYSKTVVVGTAIGFKWSCRLAGMGTETDSSQVTLLDPRPEEDK